ncbi:2OG-Fe(II) oxygenase [Sphingomonas sp. 37zxx]|uniref:2OG-Fe(II) oxygenase n=1 Tax=Sphingomonas sp. 37zxx TaxID=1550073 RepID=UPI00053BEB4E|nr:2OG-Fe(II) oxygenase family protein [Sphingomonas sp. 37zxx]
MSVPPLALNPLLDIDALAKHFAQHRRLQIVDFLAPETALAWHMHLRARTDWIQVLNSTERVIELDRAGQAALTDDQRAALENAIHASARHGFQYRYETIRVPDDAGQRVQSGDPLAAFAAWLSQGEARDALRRITGNTAIAFADAQATAYSPGDFLTGHDDQVAGKHRHAAYVLGLTPTWRAEWGGLLLFHGDGANSIEGFAPTLGTLNLFAVPQMHSVSQVSKAAAYRRYSITGWLRGGTA